MTHALPAPTPHRDNLSIDPALRDPANGARVPRCAICGMPERPHAPLLPGYWRYASRPGMDLTLCEPCVISRSPVYDSRPITIEEAA